MVSALAVALALWWWPTPAIGPRGSGMLARLGPAAIGNRGLCHLLAAVGVVAALTAGPAVGLSLVFLLGTAGTLVLGELRRHRVRLELAGLLAALRTLAREVRAGAQPAAAVAATAMAHGGAGHDVLDALQRVISSDRAHPGTRLTTGAPEADDVMKQLSERLAAGWSLSARHGIPWAGLIDATVTDLADRVRAEAARSAQVSGPRVSGYVLALMPALGLLLGAGMGADPVHVLLHTGAGNLMLLIGSTLTCAGLAWTARIVRV